MAITITKPTVGGSEDSWGTTINNALDNIAATLNGTNSTTIAPQMTSFVLDNTTVNATGAELNVLSGITASTTELNKLDGTPAGLTSTEIGYLDGVTSSIQTQLDAKAPTASPTLTGTTTVSTIALPQNWTISVSGTGASSLLKVAYNGTNILSLSTAGELIVEDNVTAFGSA